MIGLHWIAAIGLSFSTATGPTQDPVFAAATQMVGGTWRGTVGKNMPVELRFELVNDGKLIRGHGLVAKGTPQQMTIESFIGWDPIVKQPYYLDVHNHDTVYSGHVRLDGKDLVFDFTTLVGSPGHYVSRSSFKDANTYENSMSYQDKAGKMVNLGIHLQMKRSK